jgi:hypothetical protein
MLTIACENIRNAANLGDVAAYFALLLCDFATETSIICGAWISCPHKMLIQNQASKSSHTPLLPCHPLVISHGNEGKENTRSLSISSPYIDCFWFDGDFCAFPATFDFLFDEFPKFSHLKCYPGRGITRSGARWFVRFFVSRPLLHTQLAPKMNRSSAKPRFLISGDIYVISEKWGRRLQ